MAIFNVSREMGAMIEGSSSLTKIVGPPGTGKTLSLCSLIGTALSRSKVGHLRPGSTHPTVLKNPGSVLRCSDNPEGVRILVTSSCNEAVDEIARKLMEGIPDGNGGYIVPMMVRST